MERIKRYNQILLAILGTVGILLGLAVFGFLLMDFFNSSWGPSRTDSGIIAGDEIEQLRTDSLRRQVISFNQIELVDTNQGVFIIPVEFANLEKKEAIENEYYVEQDLFNSFKSSYQKFQQYSNLILHQPSTGLQQELFDKRVSISRYELIEWKDQIILLISYADEDTNKDNRLDSRDLQRLAYVVLGQNELKTVKQVPNSSFIWGFPLHDRDEIIVQIGFDKDSDGKFEYGTEPKHFYQLSVGSTESSPLLSEEIIKRLQQRLDGF